MVHIVHGKNIVDILNNIKYKLFKIINDSKNQDVGKADLSDFTFLSGIQSFTYVLSKDVTQPIQICAMY